MRYFHAAFLILLCTLVGCAQPTVVPHTSTPKIIQASVHAVIDPRYQELLIDCIDKTDISAAQYTLYTTAPPAIKNFDMTLWWGDPLLIDQGTAPQNSYAIDEDQLIFITAEENAFLRLSSREIKRIFSGILHDWSDIAQSGKTGPIEVYTFPLQTPLRSIVETSVLQDQPHTSTAKLVFTPEEMINQINSNPNSIGYTLQSSTTRSTLPVRTIPVGREFTYPILAFTQTQDRSLLSVIHCLKEN